MAYTAIVSAARPLPAPRIISKAEEVVRMLVSLVRDNTGVIRNAVAQAVTNALTGDTIEVVTE